MISAACWVNTTPPRACTMQRVVWLEGERRPATDQNMLAALREAREAADLDDDISAFAAAIDVVRAVRA